MLKRSGNSMDILGSRGAMIRSPIIGSIFRMNRRNSELDSSSHPSRNVRFNSLSAWEVIITLYINLAGVSQLFDNFTERPRRLVFCLFDDANYMQILKSLLVLI